MTGRREATATLVTALRWSDVESGHPRWEQAYRDPETGIWEVNWVMEFEPQ